MFVVRCSSNQRSFPWPPLQKYIGDNVGLNTTKMIDIRISDFNNAELASYMCIGIFCFQLSRTSRVSDSQRVTWRAILATSYTPQQGSCQQKRIHTRFSNYAKKSSDLYQICKVGADIYKTLCRSHWRRRKFIKHRFYHFQLHLEAVLLIVFTIYIIASLLYNFKTSVNREE